MKIVWNRAGGLPECPYFHWSAILVGPFSIRLHHWHSNDDPRAYHDHPHWFVTIVLWGGYTDLSPSQDGVQRDVLRIGSIRFRKAEFKHTVQEIIPSTLTFLVTGRSNRRWGFWVNHKLIKRDKYFVTSGHHPCSENDAPVRIRPDGSRR